MKYHRFFTTLALSITVLLTCAFGQIADLRRGFIKPPATARPWVYWFIMDGNFSREGITADLEAMQRVGIGGAILLEVDVGIPRGPVRFMSEEWRGLFKHAVEEAERLGLQITLNAGPGWTGSGGPWVKPEQSMQHLVASSTEISGGTTLDTLLPLPVPHKPYFGTAGLSPEMIKAQESFYVDVAVLAFPQTTNTSLIADIDEEALYIRHPYSSRPGTKPYLLSPAIASKDKVGAIPRSSILDLTGHLLPDGRLLWNAPPGEWTIMRFGRTSTGANTRPAPQPGLGLECDKFDPATLDAHFDAFIGSLMRTIGPRPNNRTIGWTMLHIDSWEMGAQNWTANFQKEFRRRRGYEVLPYLPVYTARVVENPEISERFLWDVRLTAQELVIENHAQHLKELGRKYGFGLSIEPYDMNPTADLALGAVADVPMCEFWADGDGFVTAFSSIEATSIAHTHGRPIVAAESFTGAGGQSWTRYPGSMKNQADWAFAAGINRLVFHRYAHQPWTDREPGMTMGPYGTQYERTQTWWEMSGPWHEYLARCQFLLRQGLPVADILYLTPEGAPHVFRPPPSALAGNDVMPDRKGYNFDGIDPQTLMERIKVRNGNLMLPDGMSYRVLVLPETQTMTPALLAHVEGLIQQGATIIGLRPQKSPSLVNYPQCDLEVHRLAEAMWGASSETTYGQRKLGKGCLIVPRPQTSETNDLSKPFPPPYCDYGSVAHVLEGMGVLPDFESDQTLRYLHRKIGEAEIYFVSNPSSSKVIARCTFRVKSKNVEFWDPINGFMTHAMNVKQAGARTIVPVTLETHGSIFVVFRPPLPVVGKRGIGPAMRPDLGTVCEITGPWEVSFQRGRGAPEKIKLSQLTSWTDSPDSGVRYFSGVATYKKTFRLPKSVHGTPNQALYLDLGNVQVMADVMLNENNLGILWCLPYRVEISGAVIRDSNELVIKVVNLWPNRMIGDALLPDDPSHGNKRITYATFNPFKKESKLLPSGLIGPVRLLESITKQTE